jgi:hypothetical protein
VKPPKGEQRVPDGSKFDVLIVGSGAGDGKALTAGHYSVTGGDDVEQCRTVSFKILAEDP